MSTTNMLNAAESWEKIYQAFEKINFTSYDYDAVKQSLLDYLKLYYPENFNDYIESSQLIALIELFAVTAEMLAYRVDMSVHENLLPTATRKQSILRLAKMISYTASRNLPLRGLVKITSVSTSENVTDSQGNSLTNRIIVWDDKNNPLWREQFFIVMNRVLTQSFGNPFKSHQIDDTVFQQYQVKNVLESSDDRSAFSNGVIKFKTAVNGQDFSFELVPADVDDQGVFERTPNPNMYFNLLYADDGYGDSSDTTGFMMFVKQGVLSKLVYVFDTALPNRVLDLALSNVNDVDVWVQEVDSQGVIASQWQDIPNINGINLMFNNIKSRKKYEIETREEDKIRLIFGDGDFADIPVGIFNIWVRQSNSGGVTVPKSAIKDQSATFGYVSKTGTLESCTFTYSLTSALANSAMSEDIEHIRAVAPSMYYTQDRMVNGEDYNSLPLKDHSILRLKSVNRSFSGQPKHLTWNEATGQYQNVKVFGNDGRFYYDIGTQAEVTVVSGRALIDEFIEPLLASPEIYNLIVYSYHKSSSGVSKAFVRPRTRFIEDVTQTVDGNPVLEKTVIQASIDRHWYGEPDSLVQLDVNYSETSVLPKTTFAVVTSDTDHRIYDQNLKTVIKDATTGLYTPVGNAAGVSGFQETAIADKRFAIRFDPVRPFATSLTINASSTLLTNVPNTSTLNVNTVLNAMTRKVETFTVEIIDTIGTFTVYSSVDGYQSRGKVGTPYTNGAISFLIAWPGNNQTGVCVPGDAFVIDVTKPNTNYVITLEKYNLAGQFRVISEPDLPSDAKTVAYDPNDPLASWVMIIERTDDSSGNTSYWTVTSRNFRLVIESMTTKFWFNQEMRLIDAETKLPVSDCVRLLKSNLNVDRTQAIGADQVYNVVGDVRYNDGEVNFSALAVTPVNALNTATVTSVGDPLDFLRFIGSADYVYFKKDPITGRVTPVETTATLRNLTYDAQGMSGNYIRKLGRDGLDFMWQHFTSHENMIDPTPTNIIDAYVLTRGYYSQMQDYVREIIPVEPAQPSTLELRNTYRRFTENKMISDSMVFHAGKIKLLFGAKAPAQLRATFRIVMSPAATLTSDQVRAKVLDIINDYFRIENWDFGQSFYAMKLCSFIQQSLITEIESVVVVPLFPTNYFGDLFHLRSGPDEIFMSCAKLENIEIITALDRVTMRQKS